MSLDPNKLENVRRFRSGAIQARCPACAEAGHDRKGEHLRIRADGRFGCCAFPRDREHRKTIFRLVGAEVTNQEIPNLGRLGRLKPTPIKTQVIESGILGRLGRFDLSLTRVEKIGDTTEKLKDIEKGVRAVRETDLQPTSIYPSEPSEIGPRHPRITADGVLIIPFDCAPRFHWWNGGQTIAETRRELEATVE